MKFLLSATNLMNHFSSSEVSFESGSSPRHLPPSSGGGLHHHPANVLVNPLVSPARFRPTGSPASPASSTRSPSSVYYYSDTLRPRGRGAAAVAGNSNSSDSGISSSNANHLESPPPLNPLPSRASGRQRQRGTASAGGRKGFASANV